MVSKQGPKFARGRKTFAALAVLCFSLLTCEAKTNQVVRRGLASWYGGHHKGRQTASQERFNPQDFTCASWHYAFGTLLRVRVAEHGTNLFGKSVVVRVNDRGPSKRYPDRIIDLSEASFNAIADTNLGLIQVTVEVIK